MTQFPGEFLSVNSLKATMRRKGIQQRPHKTKKPKAAAKPSKDHSKLQEEIQQLQAELKRQVAASNKLAAHVQALETKVTAFEANTARQEDDHRQLVELLQVVYCRFPKFFAELLQAEQDKDLFWQTEWTKYAIAAKEGGCAIESLAQLLAKTSPEVYLGPAAKLKSLMTPETARWLQKNALRARDKQRAVQQELEFEVDSAAGSQQEATSGETV